MKPMSMHYAIRLIAGTFVLLSVALAHWVSPYWCLFAAFVGLNLIQSSLTKWCLMEGILAKLGLATREAGGAVRPLPPAHEPTTMNQ